MNKLRLKKGLKKNNNFFSKYRIDDVNVSFFFHEHTQIFSVTPLFMEIFY